MRKPATPARTQQQEAPPKRPRQSKTSNVETRKYDEVIAANEPKILWRKNKRGVFVAVAIEDPHAETKRDVAAQQAEALRLRALELMEEEAREVTERFRKHRADNTPLMAAARTEI